MAVSAEGAAQKLGGMKLAPGDVAYAFDTLPRVPETAVDYRGMRICRRLPIFLDVGRAQVARRIRIARPKLKNWKTLSRHTLLVYSRFLRVEEHGVELPEGRVIPNWPWIVTPD